jgi:hypothetical protein
MGFAYPLIAYGLATFFVGGSLIGGLWAVFLGWFLLSAARSEEAGGRLSGLLTLTALKNVAPGARATTLIRVLTSMTHRDRHVNPEGHLCQCA